MQMQIGRVLKMLRQFHRETYKQASHHLGVGQSHIPQMETGKRDPSLGTLGKYSRGYGLPVSHIVWMCENFEILEDRQIEDMEDIPEMTFCPKSTLVWGWIQEIFACESREAA